jgi:hypothetical protein
MRTAKNSSFGGNASGKISSKRASKFQIQLAFNATSTATFEIRDKSFRY